MTREEGLDWLYRLRSNIYVYMPKEWLIPMNNALDMVIKDLEQEPTQIDEIPQDYVYDTETKDFLVYRHKYTGDEIHIKKPIPVYTLEQEPCEDAISRQAAIDVLTKTSGIRGDALKALYDLPSVTPQEPTGKNFTKADIDAIVKAINVHWEPIVDEIRVEILEYIDDLNIATEICNIFDKYKAEIGPQESEG